MPSALHFLHAMLALIIDNSGQKLVIANPNREPTEVSLIPIKKVSKMLGGDLPRAKGFYEFVDILIKLDKVLCLEISNFAQQLNLKLNNGDDHQVAGNLSRNTWFKNMELTWIRSAIPVHYC